MEFELLEDFVKWIQSEGYHFGELTELWYKDDSFDVGKTFDELIREFKDL